jgi:hypothetical protein
MARESDENDPCGAVALCGTQVRNAPYVELGMGIAPGESTKGVFEGGVSTRGGWTTEGMGSSGTGEEEVAGSDLR